MSADTILTTSISNGDGGHATRHNEANAQLNFLRGRLYAWLSGTVGKALRARTSADQGQPVAVTVAALANETQSGLETSLGAVTAVASTGVFTTAAHGLAIGDRVRIAGKTGGMYLNGNAYYVRSVPSSTTFTVFNNNLSSGSNADIGSDVTAGTMYKGVPVLEPFYDKTGGVLNPKILFADGTPVQAAGVFPQDDMVKPDPATVTRGSGIPATTALTAHTICQDDAIEIRMFNDGSNVERVMVDGVVVSTVTAANKTAANFAATSTRGRLTLTFPDRRPRRISVESQLGVIYGFARREAYPISKPVLPAMTKWLFVTDSIGDGFSWVMWVKRHLRLNNVYRASSGSTSYLNPGTTLTAALLDRYEDDVIGEAPGVVVYALGLNAERETVEDQGAEVEAATTVWDDVAEALPETVQVVIGPFPNNGGTGIDPDLVALDLLMEEAAVERGLIYLSPIQDGLTFTRRDAPGPHPDDAGNADIGEWAAGRLAALAGPA